MVAAGPLAFVAATTTAFLASYSPTTNNTIMAPQQRKKIKLSSSSLSSSSGSDVTTTTTVRKFLVDGQQRLTAADAARELEQLTKAMNERTVGTPFTESELDGVVHSLQNMVPSDAAPSLNWDDLRRLLRETAHVSHKDWSVTSTNAAKLDAILLPAAADNNAIMDDPTTRQMLERILREGNWDGAAKHAKTETNSKPWAVLVTGVK